MKVILPGRNVVQAVLAPVIAVCDAITHQGALSEVAAELDQRHRNVSRRIAVGIENAARNRGRMQEAEFYARADLAIFEREKVAEFSQTGGAIDGRPDFCLGSAQLVFARRKRFEFELTRAVGAAGGPGARRALPSQRDNGFANGLARRCPSTTVPEMIPFPGG